MTTNDLQNGDILICKSDRFISNLIKKFTRSDFNHVALYFEVWGKPGILEAQTDGINWKPLKYWVEKYGYKFIVYRPLANNKHQAKLIAQKAFTKCGATGYDFESFLIRQPLNLVHGIWNSKQDEGKRMICSEFVAWVYDLKDWEKATPKDVKKQLDRLPFYKKLDYFD